MKDLFLPYELAVIAKEKNYKGECVAFYNEMHDQIKVGTILFPADSGHWDNWNKETHLVSAPLYQQIVDWFRIKKAISVEISWNEHMKMWQGVIQDFRDPTNTYDDYGTSEDYYTTYNAVITEAFKLIP
jgi:hypothetical protein